MLRSLGPSLILGGTLAALAAMFLPYISFGGESFTWWQWLSGFDVALAIACAIAASLALVSLTLRSRRIGNLAGIGAAVAFGLAFAPVPGAIDNSHGVRAGLWIVAATGAIALAGAFVTTLTDRGLAGTASATPRRNPRWIAVALAGVVPIVALAVTDPFGYDGIKPKNPPTVDIGRQILDATDASAFAKAWARKRVRPGEVPEAGCESNETWPPSFACGISYRHAPPGYKVIRRRSSELHIAAVRPRVFWYRQDGSPDTARDRGRRNKWRIVSVIALGNESKLERKVRTALGYEVDGADIRQVQCRRQTRGSYYSCAAKLRGRRCREARVRNSPTLSIDDIRFQTSRGC